MVAVVLTHHWTPETQNVAMVRWLVLEGQGWIAKRSLPMELRKRGRQEVGSTALTEYALCDAVGNAVPDYVDWEFACPGENKM